MKKLYFVAFMIHGGAALANDPSAPNANFVGSLLGEAGRCNIPEAFDDRLISSAITFLMAKAGSDQERGEMILKFEDSRRSAIRGGASGTDCGQIAARLRAMEPLFHYKR